MSTVVVLCCVQAAGESSGGLGLDPAQQLQQAQRESAEQQQARAKTAGLPAAGNALPSSTTFTLSVGLVLLHAVTCIIVIR